MSARVTGWTYLLCLPMLLLTGGSSPDESGATPYDLRAGRDYFVGAAPIHPEKWVTSFDHPESIIRRSQSGEVSIAFDIAKNGRAVNCRVTSGSGFKRFDEIPCTLVLRRARFAPVANAEAILPGALGRMQFRFADDN